MSLGAGGTPVSGLEIAPNFGGTDKGYITLGEISGDAAAPAGTEAAIYLKDNGAGKTQLMVRFGTGAVQQIAIEP